MNPTERQCLYCRNALRGRSDKKFCNDYCRTAHNNQRYAHTNHQMRSINNILKRNRQILADCLAAACRARLSKQQLYTMGFHFGYHTHTFSDKKGNTYHFCYDTGYLPLGSEKLLVVKNKSAY
jgi:hypothetical protein